MEKDLGQALHLASSLRGIADYAETMVVSAGQADEMLAATEKFLRRAEELRYSEQT